MNKFFLATVILLGTVYAAAAQFNGCPAGFCPSVFGGGGTITPPPPLANLRITDTGAFRITDTGANRAVFP
jgi:hypothetical protein